MINGEQKMKWSTVASGIRIQQMVLMVLKYNKWFLWY